MGNWRVLLAFLAGSVVASTTTAILKWIDKPHCENEIIREFPSPNGRQVAMVVLSGCGATTPYATSVAVKDAAKDFDFDNYDAYLFIVRDKNDIEVVWDDSKSALTIIYERPTRINRQVTVTWMMPITYREKP